MSWTPEQLLKHPKVNSLLGVNIKSQPQATEKPEDNEKSTAAPSSQNSTATLSHKIFFSVPGDPMGKPRMTRRDVWKKRPVVLRYHEYCDRIRAAAPKLDDLDVYAIKVTAYIAMPSSWSKKQQAENLGMYHRSKPDWDNIGKAVCDALFEEDSLIGEGSTRKIWCREGDQRTEVKLWFNP